MAPDRTCLLLSIRPPFADAIFAGRKRVELRRTRPRLRAGDLVLVYVTAPHQELRGVLRVVRVEEAEPAAFWPLVEAVAGVGKTDFDDYFAGARQAFGIHFDHVYPFREPVAAQTLHRGGWDGFQPPQGYRYLRPHEIGLLETLLEEGLWEHLPASPAPTTSARLASCEADEPWLLTLGNW